VTIYFVHTFLEDPKTIGQVAWERLKALCAVCVPLRLRLTPMSGMSDSPSVGHEPVAVAIRKENHPWRQNVTAEHKVLVYDQPG